MKKRLKITLQWRITLLAGAVLAACMLLLALGSVFSANAGFQALTLEPTLAQTTTPAPLLPSTPAEEAVQASRVFAGQSALLYLGVLAVGMVAVYLMVGKALQPVRQLSREIREITAKNLSVRLPQNGVEDELGKLTADFNQMLNRLDSSFERQKQFVNNAAHELKTPLTVMKTGIQVLQMESSPSLQEYGELMNTTEKSVERLNRLVDDLLCLASEEYAARTEQVELQALFQIATEELSLLYTHKHIRTELCLQGYSVLGDAGLLYRAFSNLLENALKYGIENGLLRVEASETAHQVVVRVQDDGPGIPAEHLTHIFEPFYRVESSRNRKIAGSGLGLSITKAILQRHGASIEVCSAPEKGTAFTITFPTE